MPRKEKKLLLVITSSFFNCELLLSPQKAERLAKNIIKWHKSSLQKQIALQCREAGRGKYHRKEMIHDKAFETPVCIEFRQMKKVWIEELKTA